MQLSQDGRQKVVLGRGARMSCEEWCSAPSSQLPTWLLVQALIENLELGSNRRPCKSVTSFYMLQIVDVTPRDGPSRIPRFCVAQELYGLSVEEMIVSRNSILWTCDHWCMYWNYL